MKVSQAIAEIVSEFSGLNRSPNFKKHSVASCSSSGASSPSSTPPRKISEPPQRRYSVVVAVGVNPLPQVPLPTSSSDEKIKLI